MGKSIGNKKVRGVKKWLKENGYTEAQMQSFWDELIPLNSKIRMWHNMGFNWDETSLNVIDQLPTEKGRTLDKIKEMKEQEKAKALEEQKKQLEEENYINNFEEIIVNKIDSKEPLTEDELADIVHYHEVSTDYGENRRWSRTATTIVYLKGRYFKVVWDEGLTESQEDSFYTQPYEVEKHTYEKTIIVTEWRKIEK